MKTNEATTAVRSYLKRVQTGRVWAGLYLVTLTVFAWLHFNMATALEARTRVIIVNKDTVLVSEELDLMDAKELHITQAERTVQALFNRHPGGFDSESELKRLLNVPCYEKARDMLEIQTPEFEAKSLHQKVEIAETGIVRMQGRSIGALVRGQLIRFGQFDGRPLVESLDLEISMTFTHNPSLLEHGRYPTMVTEFEVTTQPTNR